LDQEEEDYGKIFHVNVIMEEVEHRWKTVPPPCLPDEDKPIEERNKQKKEGASMPPAQLAPAVQLM
jgi:hypothetical protein